jgi:aerobic carbon-monoxide dehydrogenase large subunit
LTLREQVTPQGIGKPVRRREDARLLTEGGTPCRRREPAVSGLRLRSPYAHARIPCIEVASAEAASGVLGVLTGSDADKDGLQPMPHRPVPANPHEVPLNSRDGSPFFIAPHPVLAVGKVRHVREPVALLVADTLSQAIDAAEQVAVVYEALPAVTRSADALAPGSRSLGRSTARICVSAPKPTTRRQPTLPSRKRRFSCSSR